MLNPNDKPCMVIVAKRQRGRTSPNPANQRLNTKMVAKNLRGDHPCHIHVVTAGRIRTTAAVAGRIGAAVSASGSIGTVAVVTGRVRTAAAAIVSGRFRIAITITSCIHVTSAVASCIRVAAVSNFHTTLARRKREEPNLTRLARLLYYTRGGGDDPSPSCHR
uniref:Uncharacterized protein n=1 Tax=Oryza meridionalis TaxID=40149 RepID=A0A0E0DN51_9ORYZ